MSRIVHKGPLSPGEVAPRRDPFTASVTPNDVRLRQIGIDSTKPIGPSRIGASKVIEVVGSARFAKFDAVRVPGKLAWLNFDLARRMGFDVPRSGKITEALEEEIVGALAWRALAPNEDPGERPTMRVFADRYGGSGLAGNEGAGRAAFLPWGNLNIKGIGKTPLLLESAHDFLHSHGGAPMREGVVEAIWGEVNANLFTEGSTRILAVIDTNTFTEFPDGTKERRALIVRAGSQYRPAHLLEALADGHKTTPAIFVEAAKETGHLATHEVRGQQLLDFGATMTSIVDAHAKTAAEQVRWRVLHGALSSSNMELDGAQLDLATQTSQPRTAPIHVIEHGGSFFAEHVDRAKELQRICDAVIQRLSKKQKKDFGAKAMKIPAVLAARYEHHLGVQLLKAAGLKTSVAERVAEEDGDATARFRETLMALAALTNRDGRFSADKAVAKDVSVVDVFHALQHLPETYFADPSGDHSATIRALLRPVIDTNPHHARTVLDAVGALSKQLGAAYHEVMTAAASRGADEYDDAFAMRRSITARAAFENKPLDALYKAELHHTLIERIDEFAGRGDSAIFREAIDKTVASSLRSVDALIGQGAARRIEDGLELEMRTIDGIDYSVRASSGGRRRLHVGLNARRDGDAFVLDDLPGHPRLSKAQLDHLVFRFTTDGWRSTEQVEARRDGERVTFDIPVLGGDAGQLEGVFFAESGRFWLKDGASNFRGYSFAIPDGRELERLMDALA